MSVVVSLYRRFEHLVHELTKFGSIGAVAFFITIGGGNLLHGGLGMGPLTSNAIATTVATTFSYVANRYWTFRHRDRTGLGREYILFFGLNGVGLIITQLFIGFTFYVLMLKGTLAYSASLIVGTGVATLFRFWSYKKWVFLPATGPEVDPATGLPEAHESPAPAPDSDLDGDPAQATPPATAEGPAAVEEPTTLDGPAGRRGLIEPKPVTDTQHAEFRAPGRQVLPGDTPRTGTVPIR